MPAKLAMYSEADIFRFSIEAISVLVLLYKERR